MPSAAARDGKVDLTESAEATHPPLKEVARIPSGLLDTARQVAFNLYSVDRLADAQLVLEGILAADPGDAWALSVFASLLRKQHKLRGALVLMQAALALDPDNENIRRMRDELRADVDRRTSSAEIEEVK